MRCLAYLKEFGKRDASFGQVEVVFRRESCHILWGWIHRICGLFNSRILHFGRNCFNDTYCKARFYICFYKFSEPALQHSSFIYSCVLVYLHNELCPRTELTKYNTFTKSAPAGTFKRCRVVYFRCDRIYKQVAGKEGDRKLPFSAAHGSEIVLQSIKGYIP